MKIEEGCIIQSTLLLQHDYFANCNIYIIQHNHKGSVGFVFNKSSRKSIYIGSVKHTIFKGGPIISRQFNLLHKHPLEIAGSIHIANGIYWNNNVEENFLQSINHQIKNFKILSGYCGWDANELQQEVDDGFWKICLISSDQIFSFSH